MKFVCLACDEPMTLAQAEPPDEGGSIAASFQCPRCGHGVAMLTNAWETEVVRSLGVKLGNGNANRCPFGAMTTSRPEIATTPAALAASGATGATGATEGLTWTAAALERLERIPAMVRPMAREGIESFARRAGRGVVDEALLEQARGGMLG